MKNVILIIAFISSLQVFSQEKDLAFFGGALFQKEAAENVVGGELSVRYYVKNKLSLGMQSTYSGKKFNDGFNYMTDRTILNNIALSTLVQYDLLNNDRFFAGVYVLNGIRAKTLRNLNDTETYEYFDEFGSSFYVDVPQKLNRDIFYVFTPGLDLSFKLAVLGKIEKVGLYITSRGGYEFNFGKDNLSNRMKSQQIVWSIGLTVKGTTISME